MKILVVISSKEPENAWNAFRLASLAADKKDEVTVFLLNSGVECLKDAGKHNVKTISEQFAQKGGKLLACGTCLKSRNLGGVCPISNMETLYKLIKESDKAVYL